MRTATLVTLACTSAFGLWLVVSGAGCGPGISDSFATLRFETFQPAEVVIGQTSFTSFTPQTTRQNLNNPQGNPVYLSGRLLIPDTVNHRVLAFKGIPTSNGTMAEFVLGQTLFADAVSGVVANQMHFPRGLATDGTRLAVGEYNNMRVTLRSAYNEASADAVAGDDGFNSPNGSCAPAITDTVTGVAIGGGKLLAADMNQNRVLIWNSIPASGENGADADLVLGQASMTKCARNDANADDTPDDDPSANTLYGPHDVWTDGTRIIVADTFNNRVLIWNSFPANATAFKTADLVLGQSDFITTTLGSSSSRMSAPMAIASNGTFLAVADAGNHRVLIWHRFPTTKGQAADVVLGHAAFNRNTPNDDNGDGSSDSNPSARVMSLPSGLLLHGDKLLVADTNNSRVLVFQGKRSHR